MIMMMRIIMMFRRPRAAERRGWGRGGEGGGNSGGRGGEREEGDGGVFGLEGAD